MEHVQNSEHALFSFDNIGQGGRKYLELSRKFLELMSPWHEHTAESRMMIAAYQNLYMSHLYDAVCSTKLLVYTSYYLL